MDVMLQMKGYPFRQQCRISNEHLWVWTTTSWDPSGAGISTNPWWKEVQKVMLVALGGQFLLWLVPRIFAKLLYRYRITNHREQLGLISLTPQSNWFWRPWRLLTHDRVSNFTLNYISFSNTSIQVQLNPIEKFKRSILHLNRSLHQFASLTVTNFSQCDYV